MTLLWLFFCLVLTLAIALLSAWPVLRHASLPRRKKLFISLIIFLVLVPGSLALYTWVGVPIMAAL